MENLRSKLGFICDMDGVIYHGNRILPGVKEFVAWLYDNDKEFLFLTNSSERSPRELQQKLARMGLEVSEKHFYTSALATAKFISSQAPGGSAYVIGGAGLIMALHDEGITMNDVVSVGIGTPGSVNKKNGVIEYANNLAFDNVPARDILESRLKKTVYLDNDANCAALGEAKAGAGKGVNSFVAVTLGTGVGSGIVIDGKIVTGVNDAAGEMGHMVIVADGEPCTCGRRAASSTLAAWTLATKSTPL